MDRLRSLLALSLSVCVASCVMGLGLPAEVSAEAAPISAGSGQAVSSGGQNFEDQLFTGVTPARILETRPTGVTVDGQYANSGPFSGTKTVQVTGRGGIPAGVGAVVINVTVTNPVGQGYTTIFPTGTARPNASTLNFLSGTTVANAVVAKLNSTGSLSVFNMAKADVIIDVSGWIPAGADYFALAPARLTDTRPARRTIDMAESGKGAFAASRAVKVTGRGGVPSTGVGAVVLNVTATNEATAGYTTVYPTGESRPTTSNVNFDKGRDKAGLVISKIGSDGTVTMYNSIRSDLVVDVIGWFPEVSDYNGQKPARLVDTRNGRSTIDGLDLAGGAFTGVRTYRVTDRDQVPSRASAVVLNVTVTQPETNGYTTAFAGGESPRPLASNVNFSKGQTTSNLVVATVGLDGEVAIYNSSPTHLVVDVFGWLPGFVPVKGTPPTAQISLSRDGTPGNVDSTSASISGDGRFTAYASDANNLVPGDTTGFRDVFVHDAQTMQVTRVSVSTGGAAGDDNSDAPRISADGRYVVFESDATNLVGNDTNNVTDVFVHDRDTATTTRASLATGAAETAVESEDRSTAPSVSDDGRYVAFSSVGRNLVVGDTNNLSDVFIRDTVLETTVRVSTSTAGTEGSGASTSAVVSGNGSSVVFRSQATNLVSGDTNGVADIFRRDLGTNAVTIVSKSGSGVFGNGASDSPDVSDDGRYVSFRSLASNLVTGDTNAVADIFVHDAVGGATTRVSVSSGQVEASSYSNLQAISGNGRYVTFSSVAANLVAGDVAGREDIFVHDRQTGSTTRASVGLGAIDANQKSYAPTISSNGRYLGFTSDASNLVDLGDGSFSQIYKSQNPAMS